MSDTLIRQTAPAPGKGSPPDVSCIMVIFGTSGDLTKRLLMPALYNLTCDGLLPKRFALVGVARNEMSDDQFRQKMADGVREFKTRPTFDENVWKDLASRMYHSHGPFEDPQTYARLSTTIARAESERQTGGNLLFYLATPPNVFATISGQLGAVGLCCRKTGWSRLVIEKPFGRDLASAIELTQALLKNWREDQLFRIDHYLGKETVQNLLAFRFANGAYEPLWNNRYIDHVQLTVSETVNVEGRGGYYDKVGVLRDMIQNHMFQMLAYVAMEPPSSFKADAIRNEKSKLLDAIRLFEPEDVATETVRGQYGEGKKADGSAVVAYRKDKGVAPDSRTETFAALKLSIDNWRWHGVPFYLRFGKALWKRGTEIVVEFKKAPDAIFKGTPAEGHLDANRLIFHIQPDQGIEFRFHAKTPGPAMALQKVNMRFDYKEAFEAARGTGYEVLIYNAMAGDATLFSRTDLVERAWRIAQPILDAWAATPPADFPNYDAGSWGPAAAYDLLARDGRRWVEIVNRGLLDKVPLFKGTDPLFQQNLALMLRPTIAQPGAEIVCCGGTTGEMYFICRGQAEAVTDSGKVVGTMNEGDFFGELCLLLGRPRNATVRAVTPCDLFVLDRSDFEKVLHDYPQIGASLQENAKKRYVNQ